MSDYQCDVTMSVISYLPVQMRLASQASGQAAAESEQFDYQEEEDDLDDKVTQLIEGGREGGIQGDRQTATSEGRQGGIQGDGQRHRRAGREGGIQGDRQGHRRAGREGGRDITCQLTKQVVY